MTPAPASNSWLATAWAALRPPPKLSLSQWADRHFRLSAESSAEPGRWKTLSYQRAILDAITDPSVERVTVKKSARIGYTKSINAAIAFFIAHDPCPIMVVQPTIENAKIYSKEEIAPMLRDVEALRGLVTESRTRNTENTVAHKTFPGGLLAMVGANSGRGFRMVSRRVVIFDEVDAYPASAGNEGDPIKLGEKRAEYYWNRKIIAGSTPLVDGASRIDEMFEAGDRRRYYVPCPHCDHMDFLRFRERSGDAGPEGGHVMKWDASDGSDAHFMCRSCGCAIEEKAKRAMIERGSWRSERAFVGHASFHIWAAYSLSPNATWSKLAAEFLEAVRRPETLRTFVNTALAETWKEQGDAPDWARLHERRETYATVPSAAIALTAGVDVQKDRFVYEVVGWAPNLESWSVDAGEIYGDTAIEETWDKLDELLARTYDGDGKAKISIAKLGIDSGYRTQLVYAWARKNKARVIATKGIPGARVLLGQPTPVDVTVAGKKYRRGAKVWPVGVDVAKGEIYDFLGLARGSGEPPRGFCHFPDDRQEEYFKQLTAEQLVTVIDRRTRRAKREWHVLPNRENHYLDCRVIARVVAAHLGIERFASKPTSSPPPSAPRATSAIEPESRDSFWKPKRPRSSRGGSWFKPRR